MRSEGVGCSSSARKVSDVDWLLARCAHNYYWKVGKRMRTHLNDFCKSAIIVDAAERTLMIWLAHFHLFVCLAAFFIMVCLFICFLASLLSCCLSILVFQSYHPQCNPTWTTRLTWTLLLCLVVCIQLHLVICLFVFSVLRKFSTLVGRWRHLDTGCRECENQVAQRHLPPSARTSEIATKLKLPAFLFWIKFRLWFLTLQVHITF